MIDLSDKAKVELRQIGIVIGAEETLRSLRRKCCSMIETTDSLLGTVKDSAFFLPAGKDYICEFEDHIAEMETVFQIFSRKVSSINVRNLAEDKTNAWYREVFPNEDPPRCSGCLWWDKTCICTRPNCVHEDKHMDPVQVCEHWEENDEDEA